MSSLITPTNAVPEEESAGDPFPALRTRGIRKMFPGLVALDNVNLTVERGEIHAIVGQNGAGKSTLVKILTGVYQADEGEILVDGRPVTITGPLDARTHGIAIVHQDQPLVPQMTVARNAFLGRELRTRTGLLDLARMRQRTDAALAVIEADFTAATLVEELSVAQRMQAAIAAALVEQPQVLILDEPTASLGAPEANRLFAAIRAANQAGVTIIYISHRLGEITGLASVATVLRDGRLVDRLDLTTSGRDDMIRSMIGRELSHAVPPRHAEVGGPVCTVEGLSTAGTLDEVDLTVRSGEVVGLAGLVGSGASDIALSIFGALKATRGTIRVGEVAGPYRSPQAAARAGVALVPEDRRHEGILSQLTITANLGISATTRLSRFGWLNTRAERDNARQLMTRLQVAATGPGQPVGTLSGGNQQKVMIGRWLARGASLYVLDEPTAGVDVGSKVEIYRQLGAVAEEGAGVLIISSDFEELLAVCDRIMVIVNGRVASEVTPADVDLEGLTTLAAGGSLDPSGTTDLPAATAATPTAPPQTASDATGRRRFTLTSRSVATVGMAAIIALIAAGAPGFLSLDNLMTVFRQGSVGALVACALTIVLAAGGIDLSVGGLTQLSANAVSWAVIAGTSAATALGLGVVAGLLVGVINGVVIYVFRVPSFVATLGMLFLLMGGSLYINGGLALRVPADRIDFRLLGQGYVGVVPVVTLLLAGAVAVLHLWLRRTGSGGRVYASGSNPDAAVLRGVNPRRYTLVAFAVSGAVAGFAGVLSASYSSGASATDQSMTLLVAALSAAFLGAALSPTREFNVVGAATAALFIAAVSNGLILNGVSNILLPGVQGAILLAAVLVAAVRRRRLGQVNIF